jgi:hypothetical protein
MLYCSALVRTRLGTLDMVEPDYSPLQRGPSS